MPGIVCGDCHAEFTYTGHEEDSRVLKAHATLAHDKDGYQIVTEK